MFYVQDFIIFEVILWHFMTSTFISGQVLPESLDRHDACAASEFIAACPVGKQIAVKGVQYGTNKCSLSKRSGECCNYKPTDCLINSTDRYLQHGCSGKDHCIDGLTATQVDTTKCKVNNYATMEYYCISSKFG